MPGSSCVFVDVTEVSSLQCSVPWQSRLDATTVAAPPPTCGTVARIVRTPSGLTLCVRKTNALTRLARTHRALASCV